MQEMEEMEKVRKSTGRKALQSDLNKINQKILEENNLRRSKEKEEMRSESNYFPFVHGEQLEAHRDKINS